MPDPSMWDVNPTSYRGRGYTSTTTGTGQSTPFTAPRVEQTSAPAAEAPWKPPSHWSAPDPRTRVPSFARQGVGKYYNPRNLQGNQFNKPAINKAIQTGIQAYSEARYFRRAGFSQALRHTFGMEQLPSHVNDYLVARHNRQVRGLNPQSITAQYPE